MRIAGFGLRVVWRQAVSDLRATRNPQPLKSKI